VSRWSGVVLRAVLLLVLSGLLAGCGGSSAGPTPAQELRARLAALVAARSLGLEGQVSLGDVTYHVGLTEDDRGQAVGAVRIDQTALTVTWAGGRLFLLGSAYFAAQQIYVGGRWVLAHGDKLVALLTKLTARSELAQAFASLSGPDVRRRGGAVMQGQRTIELFSDGAVATVPANGGAPLRLATAVDQRLSDDLNDLSLGVTVSDRTATVTAPTSYADMADRNTLPTYLHWVDQPASTFHIDGCDPGGCMLSAEFHNYGGKVGQAVATFSTRQGDVQLGSCTVAVPVIGYDESTRAGCRVNFDHAHVSASSQVAIANPA